MPTPEEARQLGNAVFAVEKMGRLYGGLFAVLLMLLGGGATHVYNTLSTHTEINHKQDIRAVEFAEAIKHLQAQQNNMSALVTTLTSGQGQIFFPAGIRTKRIEQHN